MDEHPFEGEGTPPRTEVASTSGTGSQPQTVVPTTTGTHGQPQPELATTSRARSQPQTEEVGTTSGAPSGDVTNENPLQCLTELTDSLSVLPRIDFFLAVSPPSSQPKRGHSCPPKAVCRPTATKPRRARSASGRHSSRAVPYERSLPPLLQQFSSTQRGRGQTCRRKNNDDHPPPQSLLPMPYQQAGPSRLWQFPSPLELLPQLSCTSAIGHEMSPPDVAPSNESSLQPVSSHSDRPPSPSASLNIQDLITPYYGPERPNKCAVCRFLRILAPCFCVFCPRRQ